MQYEEFVNRVQDRGEFASRDEAIKATRAILSTLGECLYQTERRHLASQLPKELKEFVHEYVDASEPIRRRACFTLGEFYNRVAARADVTQGPAMERARAVVTVLREAVPEGEWAHVIREMPDDYGELLEEESSETPAP
ncbi:MAG: DUF2267 domain-containing protein [Anaerolineales bacterium]